MTLAIVPNINTAWYDPSRISGDPLIVQNVNYAGAGTLKSTSKTTVRLLQDMMKRLLPTCVRVGLGIGTADVDITIGEGAATINGRWILNDSPATVDASVLANGTYYLYITLSELLEGENREPQSEGISFTTNLIGTYEASANKLVLAKFSVTAGVPTIIVTYTDVAAQWAAAAIVPPIGIDGSAYDSVGIYSGSIEKQLEGLAETNGFRITRRMIMDDTDATPVGQAHLRNRDQELQARNAPGVDNDYVAFHVKSLKVNGSEAITNARALINIPSVNSKTIPEGSGAITDVNSIQTLTNKTLTAPVLSIPAISDFTSAVHNHQNAAGGGQIVSAAISGQISPDKGGTGLGTYATGDLIYANATNSLAKRTIGSNNSLLKVVSGVPSWNSLIAADIPNLDASKTTTGIFADGRIPNLNTSKITAGIFTEARIPSRLYGYSFYNMFQSFHYLIQNTDQRLTQEFTAAGGQTKSFIIYPPISNEFVNILLRCRISAGEVNGGTGVAEGSVSARVELLRAEDANTSWTVHSSQTQSMGSAQADGNIVQFSTNWLTVTYNSLNSVDWNSSLRRIAIRIVVTVTHAQLTGSGGSTSGVLTEFAAFSITQK
jgi:hypothetical protein